VAGLVAALILLSVVYTWPLARAWRTHLPGQRLDNLAHAWNLWWVSRVLAGEGELFFTRLLAHPHGLDLRRHTLGAANGLLAAPLVAWFGAVGAYNLLVVAFFVLEGVALYFLGRTVGLSVAGASAAALLGAAAPAWTAQLLLGHLNLLATFWLPLILAAGVRARERPLQGGAMAGVVLAATLWTDFTLAAMACLALLGAQLHRGLLERKARRVLPGLALPWVLAGVLAGPLLLGFAAASDGGGGDAQAGWGTMRALHIDPTELVIPAPHLRFLGAWGVAAHEDKGGFWGEAVAFPGWIVLALALWGALRRLPPRLRLLRRLTLLSLLLACGPRLEWAGRPIGLLPRSLELVGEPSGFPLPYALMAYLPLLRELRVPGRFVLLAAPCLALLAGHGLDRLRNLVRRPAPGEQGRGQAPRIGGIALGLCVLLPFLGILETLPRAIELVDTRLPAELLPVGDDPEPGALLEIPLGWRDGFRIVGLEDTRQQIWQTVHGRPIVSGFAARISDATWGLLLADPGIRSLLDLEMKRRPSGREDEHAIAAMLRSYRVRYVVLHPPWGASSLGALFAGLPGLERLPAPEDAAVFRVIERGGGAASR
jgi:hypothetical protein